MSDRRGISWGTAGCFSDAVFSKKQYFGAETRLYAPKLLTGRQMGAKTCFSAPKCIVERQRMVKLMASRRPSYSQKYQFTENNIHGRLPYTQDEPWCTRSNLKCLPYTSLALCTEKTKPTKNVNIPISFPVPPEGCFVAREGIMVYGSGLKRVAVHHKGVFRRWGMRKGVRRECVKER